MNDSPVINTQAVGHVFEAGDYLVVMLDLHEDRTVTWRTAPMSPVYD